jgi:hypothetical protein
MISINRLLSPALVKAFERDFAENGARAISDLRRSNVAQYLRFAGVILPAPESTAAGSRAVARNQEVNMVLEQLSDDEFGRLLHHLQTAVDEVK